QLLEPLLARRALEIGSRLEDGEDVVLDRELAENGSFLRQVAEPELRPPVHRQQSQIGVIEVNAARIAGHEPDDHVEGRRLTGAVGSEETDHLAVGDLDTEIANDLTGFVALLEPARAQGRHVRTGGGVLEAGGGPAAPDARGGAVVPLSSRGGGGFGEACGVMVICTPWCAPDEVARTFCSRML